MQVKSLNRANLFDPFRFLLSRSPFSELNGRLTQGRL